MASSVHLSWLCRVRPVQGLLNLRLLPQRSTIWSRNVCRAPTCKFSKSSGPVRYIPKSARLQGRDEQSLAQSRTKNEDSVSSGDEVEGIDRFRSSMPSKKKVQRFKDARHVDDEFFHSAKMRGTCLDFDEDQEDNFGRKHFSLEAEQINVKRERSMHTGSFSSPLRLSHPTSRATIQSFPSKAQKSASSKKTVSEMLGRVNDAANFSAARAVEYAPNTTPENEDSFLSNEDSFLSDDDMHMLDGQGIRVLNEESVLADDFSELEDGLEDIANFSPGSQPTSIQPTRFREAEAGSRVAQEDAKNQAIRYLAMRQYTAFQLRKKLTSRNISPDLVEYAIAVVRDCGMQSDLGYAETFAHSRWNVRSWGPQRIKQALKQRGVSDDIVKIVIDRVFNENKNDLDHLEPNSIGMSKSSIDQLLMQATKQWNRGKTVSDDTKVRRMICWLQYRGFNYKVIQTVLKFLQKKSFNTEI